MPVAQSSAESEYNTTFTTGTDLAHFRIINNELLNKDLDLVPEQAHIIILDIKSSTCMDNSDKDKKHIRQISRIMNISRYGEECSFHRMVCVREVYN